MKKLFMIVLALALVLSVSIAAAEPTTEVVTRYGHHYSYDANVLNLVNDYAGSQVFLPANGEEGANVSVLAMQCETCDPVQTLLSVVSGKTADDVVTFENAAGLQVSAVMIDAEDETSAYYVMWNNGIEVDVEAFCVNPAASEAILTAAAEIANSIDIDGADVSGFDEDFEDEYELDAFDAYDLEYAAPLALYSKAITEKWDREHLEAAGPCPLVYSLVDADAPAVTIYYAYIAMDAAHIIPEMAVYVLYEDDKGNQRNDLLQLFTMTEEGPASLLVGDERNTFALIGSEDNGEVYIENIGSNSAFETITAFVHVNDGRIKPINSILFVYDENNTPTCYLTGNAELDTEADAVIPVEDAEALVAAMEAPGYTVPSFCCDFGTYISTMETMAAMAAE